MQFICKIVKDCIHSDGIRDYQFKVSVNETLLTNLERALDQEFTIRKLGDKRYFRMQHPHYKLFGYLDMNSIRIEFLDYHPKEARDLLETVFASW